MNLQASQICLRDVLILAGQFFFVPAKNAVERKGSTAKRHTKRAATDNGTLFKSGDIDRP